MERLTAISLFVVVVVGGGGGGGGGGGLTSGKWTCITFGVCV